MAVCWSDCCFFCWSYQTAERFASISFFWWVVVRFERHSVPNQILLSRGCEWLTPEMKVFDQFAINQFRVIIIDDSSFQSGAAIDLDPWRRGFDVMVHLRNPGSWWSMWKEAAIQWNVALEEPSNRIDPCCWPLGGLVVAFWRWQKYFVLRRLHRISPKSDSLSMTLTVWLALETGVAESEVTFGVVSFSFLSNFFSNRW